MCAAELWERRLRREDERLGHRVARDRRHAKSWLTLVDRDRRDERRVAGRRRGESCRDALSGAHVAGGVV
jgi:hypothetical protein